MDLAEAKALVGRELAGVRLTALLAVGRRTWTYQGDNPLDPGVARAIKVLVPGGDPEVRARLVRDAEAVERLRHPGIVGYFGLRADQGFVFVEQELLEGEDLLALKGRTRSVDSVVSWIRAAAEATSAAHALNPPVAHGDLRLANLFLTRAGRVVVLDFGFASAGATPAGDVHDLGVAAWELLVGRPPEPGASLRAVRPDVPAWVDAAVARCLDPQRRWPDAGAFAAALVASRSSVVVESPPVAAAVRPAPAPDRFATNLVVVLLVGFGGLFVLAAVATIVGLVMLGNRLDDTFEEVAETVEPSWVRVDPARFTMGSALDTPERETDEGPVEVELTRPFLVSTHEVTQALWTSVMGDSFAARTMRWDGEEKGLCTDWGGLDLSGSELPMACVSWTEAVIFANAMSEREGLDDAYAFEGSVVIWRRWANGYRLPTEAEWELAARAGTDLPYAGTAFAEGVCGFGNVPDTTARALFPEWTTFACNDGAAGPTPVGSFAPNALGLYDMMGNVWEWSWDWYAEALPGGTDPEGAASGSSRSTRGGSWYTGTIYAQIANRNWVDPTNRDINLGIRLVRTVE